MRIKEIKSMKRLWQLSIFVLIAIFVLAACAQPAPATQPPKPAATEAPTMQPTQVAATQAPPAPTNKCKTSITIGYVPPQTILVWNVAEQYMKKAAEQAKQYGFDIKVITQAPVVDTEFSDQGRIIDDFINRGVSVLVVGPIDIPPLIAPIKRANTAGIPVIVLNMLSGFPEDQVKVLAYVGMENYDAGLKAGQWAAKKLDGKGKVAIIQGIVGSIYEEQRTKGFMDGIAGTQIEVVAKGPGDWARDKARSVAEDFITAHPDLNLVFAESAEMGLGAAAAVDSAKMRDKIVVQTQDGTTESIEAVSKGILDADLWHGFPTWGYRSVEIATKAVNGISVSLKNDVGLKVIDKANINLFYPEPSEEVLGPINWQGIVDQCK
jgi:ribose transport system substrate-binding protein